MRDRPAPAPVLRSFAPAVLLATLVPSAPLAAQAGPDVETGQDDDRPAAIESDGYLRPPGPVLDAVMAPWHRNVEPEEPSPDGGTFVVEVRDRRMPPLALFARPHHHLAGLQVDPAAKRERDFTTDPPDRFELLDAETGERTPVETPAGTRVSDATWSPDGSMLAFFVHHDDATHIRVADPATGESRRITPRPVLATLTTSFDWTADGSTIWTVLVPRGMGPEPDEAAVPTSPRVTVTSPGEENRLRTYPDLLDGPHEAALLEHWSTGQLARIDVATGQATDVGAPAMIASVDASPDGRWVRVTTVEKPFSWVVPTNDFARTDAIWAADGERVAVVNEHPVDDGSDEDDDGADRRSVAWRPDGTGLGFLEREPRPEGADTADADEEADDDRPRMDRLYRWAPPFDDAALTVVFESEHSLDDPVYGEGLVFLTEEDDDEGVERLIAVEAGGARRVVASHDPDDPDDDFGDLVTHVASPEAPEARLSPDGRHAYLEGTDHPEDPLQEPPRPWLDRVSIDTGETVRLFTSPADALHEVEEVLSDDAARLLVSRESATDPPDWFVQAPDGSGAVALTSNEDHAPDITGARREAVWATRPDGLRFLVRITLPVGYQEGMRVPAIFWHYPSEYEDEDAYLEDAREYNRNEFPSTSPRSMETLVRMGYAVVEPDVPIVGPRRQWNDLYVLHLRNSLAAAIDALDARGWIDRGRLAIGGHSYGGFGTINAMIRTPFFKAGIAGAANSNRTLTPAGFQRESRVLWEARETYARMSPLLYMNELSGALLLYHGEDDQNVGTFPDHSLRSFHALNALGKTAALYMYPYEAHGQRAEETVLDMWARWTAWLDEYVKGEEDAASVTEDAGPAG